MKTQHVLKRARWPIAIAFALLVTNAFAVASWADEPKKTDDWEFAVNPYVWFLFLDGDITVKGQTQRASVKFGDIFKDINFAVMVEAEARKGRVGGFVNTIFGALGDDKTVQGVKLDVSVDLLYVGFGAYYRLGPWALEDAPGENGATLTVDPYVGGRYTYIDTKVDVVGIETIKDNVDWIDPILGVRTLWDLSERWSIDAAADIGGFGAGSDFTWHAFGLIGYRFNLFGERDARVLVGYRALYQDYEKGSGASKFEWDVTVHGPVMALNIEF